MSFRSSPAEGHDQQEPSQQPDDPVARWFEQARTGIQPQQTSDLDWQQVLRARRTNRRPASWHTALAAAAAVVVAAFALLTWQQHPMGVHGVTPGSAVATNATRGGVSGSPSPEPVSSAQKPSAVPASFETWSLSNAGSSTLYDLGSSNCQQEVCVTLLRSSDNGGSWTAVHNFSGTDTSSATGSDVPQIQPTRAITQTRFVSPQTGYVFGGDLWVTHDRGSSFTKMRHPGQTVLDVEIYRGDVLVVSADGCAQGTCSGTVYLSRISPKATSIDKATATIDPASPISDAALVVHAGQVELQLSPTKTSARQAAYSLRGHSLVAITAPSACHNSPLQAMTAAANADGVLFAVCNPRQEQQNVGYTVVRSTDGGAHWTVQSVSSLVMPRLGQLTLAAGDPAHLVVSNGGPRDPGGPSAATSVGSLQVSGNGGVTFGHAQSSAHLPAGGFDWVASPGGSEFYALSRQNPTYWRSTDHGRKWTVVDPIRRH